MLVPGVMGSNPKVLVVDAPLVVQALRRLLRGAFEITGAESPEDAVLLLAERDDFDALVFDVDSVLARGVYGALLKDAAMARRIIFVTSTTYDAETELFLEASGRPWLAKPYTTEAMTRDLEKVLATKPPA